MAAITTVGELFDLAIGAEQAAERAYWQLARMFAQHQSVAQFWTRYAEQEAQHARWLAEIRDSVETTVLGEPGEPEMVQNLRRVAGYPVKQQLAGIETLEDAYLLVSDLENSETNVVFEFLADRYAGDVATQRFLRAQLRDHVGDLMVEFPARFGNASVRRSVRAEH